MDEEQFATDLLIERIARGERKGYISPETLIQLDILGLGAVARKVGFKVTDSKPPENAILIGSLDTHLPGSIQVPCDECQRKVWVMPHNYDLGFKAVLCTPCTALHADKEESDDG